MKPLAWGGSARREGLGNKNARKRRNCRKDGKRSFTSDKVCRYVNVEPKTNAAPYEGLLVGQKQSQRVRLLSVACGTVVSLSLSLKIDVY